MEMQKCFDILELDSDATAEEARHAYKTQVKFYHPDRFAGDDNMRKVAEERLKRINLAYEKIKPVLEIQQQKKASASESSSAPKTAYGTEAEAVRARAASEAAKIRKAQQEAQAREKERESFYKARAEQKFREERAEAESKTRVDTTSIHKSFLGDLFAGMVNKLSRIDFGRLFEAGPAVDSMAADSERSSRRCPDSFENVLRNAQYRTRKGGSGFGGNRKSGNSGRRRENPWTCCGQRGGGRQKETGRVSGAKPVRGGRGVGRRR